MAEMAVERRRESRGSKVARRRKLLLRASLVFDSSIIGRSFGDQPS